MIPPANRLHRQTHLTAHLVQHTQDLAKGDNVDVLRAGIGELGRAARDLNAAIRRDSQEDDGEPDAESQSEIVDVEFRVEDT